MKEYILQRGEKHTTQGPKTKLLIKKIALFSTFRKEIIRMKLK